MPSLVAMVRRLARRTAVTGSLALAVVTLVTAPAIGDPASSLPRCKTSGLTIRLLHTGAGLGTAGGYIGFTNRARRACSLTGWPTLVAVAASGRRQRAVHVRS